MRTLLRNVLANWVGYLVVTLTGFFLSPVIVRHLGNTGYGVWTLIISLTGYFGLLDLGIRSSVGRFVARHAALNDHLSANRTISTALAMLCFGGALALLATLVLYALFDRTFHVEPQYYSAARTALLIAGLNVSFTLPWSIFGTVLISLERFDILTGITMASTLARAALVLASLKAGYGLVMLAVILLVANLLQYLATTIAAKRIYPPLNPSWRLVDASMGKELFGFSILRFIWIVANQVIFYTDSVVIGVFLNAAAITPYAIASTLLNYGRNIVSLATDTLYPKAARLDSNKDQQGLRELHILGTRIGLLVGLPICMGFVFLGEQFITLWMGPEYASSAVFLAILTLPQLLSMSQQSSALILAGMAKHRMLAYLVMLEAVINLTLSIVLVRKIGLVGVAWGAALPHLLITGILLPLYTLRMLNLSLREYLTRAFVTPLLCGAPVALLCALLTTAVNRGAIRLNPSWFLFGVEGAAMCLAFAGLSYRFCLTASQRAHLRTRVRLVLADKLAIRRIPTAIATEGK